MAGLTDCASVGLDSSKKVIQNGDGICAAVDSWSRRGDSETAEEEGRDIRDAHVGDWVGSDEA